MCGAITRRSLWRPALPLSSGSAQARRQSWPPPHILAMPAPANTTAAPLRQAYSHRPPSTRPRHHAARLPPFSSPVRMRTPPCAPQSLASLLPHSHFAPRPLPAFPNSGPHPPAASHVRFSIHCPPLRRGMVAELPHLLGLGVGGHPLSRAARLPLSCTSA